jgi:hypothetical protein
MEKLRVAIAVMNIYHSSHKLSEWKQHAKTKDSCHTSDPVILLEHTPTSFLAHVDPGGLGTSIVNVKTWWLGQVTMSTGASAPRIIDL